MMLHGNISALASKMWWKMSRHQAIHGRFDCTAEFAVVTIAHGMMRRWGVFLPLQEGDCCRNRRTKITMLRWNIELYWNWRIYDYRSNNIDDSRYADDKQQQKHFCIAGEFTENNANMVLAQTEQIFHFYWYFILSHHLHVILLRKSMCCPFHARCPHQNIEKKKRLMAIQLNAVPMQFHGWRAFVRHDPE